MQNYIEGLPDVGGADKSLSSIRGTFPGGLQALGWEMCHLQQHWEPCAMLIHPSDTLEISHDLKVEC